MRTGPPAEDERRKAERIALASLGAALFLVIAKLLAGFASGSLAILSEAAHSTLDAGATLITFFAIRIASRPPDADHPYGHGKAENVSALIETFGLLALSFFIGREAINRLGSGGTHVVASWYAFGVIILSIIVDVSRSRTLRIAGRRYRSAALQADALHFTADLLTSGVVLAGLVFVRLGYPLADAIGGLLVAGYVALASLRLGKGSIDVLMDRAPTGSLARIEDAAGAVEGVEEVRRVRVRYSGGQPQTDVVIAISRTVPLERAHSVTEEVERVIRDLEPGADVVVHVEPTSAEEEVTQKILALAARHSKVSQVHNVHVTHQRDGLHISLHAKFPPEMTLAEAHQIAEELESEISGEVRFVARVDTHLEPLERRTVATDVTGGRTEMAARAKIIAEQLVEVETCHEVVVTDTGAGSLDVLMHCEAAPGTAVDRIHDASTRIESEMHRLWPEIERVTVHFEPARIG